MLFSLLEIISTDFLIGPIFSIPQIFLQTLNFLRSNEPFLYSHSFIEFFSNSNLVNHYIIAVLLKKITLWLPKLYNVENTLSRFLNDDKAIKVIRTTISWNTLTWLLVGEPNLYWCFQLTQSCKSVPKSIKNPKL